MAQAVLNLKNLSDAGVIKRGNELKAGMDGNANLMTPDPTVEDFGALISAGEAGMTQATGDANKSQHSTLAKDNAIAAIILAAGQWGAQVQAKSKGDPDIIKSFNMGVKSPNAPIGPLDQVQNLSLTTGDQPGEVDGHWNAVHGKSNYEHQRCLTDPNVEANWQFTGSCSPSKTTLRGQPSGTRVWVRVRAKAPKDQNDGPWSQSATIIVP